MKLIFHINYYYLIHKVSKISKAFENDSSAKMKFAKIQLCNMMQSGGIMTGIYGIDNFVNFPFKVMKSHSKELSNILKN